MLTDNELVDGYIADIKANGDLILDSLEQRIDDIFLKDYHQRIHKYHESIRGRREVKTQPN